MEHIKDKVVLIHGMMSTLDLFIEALAKGFEKEYQIYLLDITNIQEAMNGLFEYMKNPGRIIAAISFNGVGSNIMIEKINVWKHFAIPFIDIVVDNPIYFNDRFMNEVICPDVVLCIDQEHADYVNSYIDKVALSAFLPHGGACVCKEKRSINERKIDILYAGGNRNVCEYLPIGRLSYEYTFDAINIMEEIHYYMMKNPSYSLLSATDSILNRNNIQISNCEKRYFLKDSIYVEANVLTVYRNNMLLTLAKAGLPITLCGSYWEESEILNYPNVTFLGALSPSEVLARMGDAKIVLNHTAWFKNGSHERVFNAMLAGAVCVSDSTKYLEETFCTRIAGEVDARELLLYDVDKLEHLPTLITDLLSDYDSMQKIADRGYEKAKRSHTWECRAHEIATDLFPYLQRR